MCELNKGKGGHFADDIFDLISWKVDIWILINTVEPNFSDIWNNVYTFSINQLHVKVSSTKFCPFWSSLNIC